VTCSHAWWIVSHAHGAGGGEEAHFIGIVAANIFLKATFPAKAHSAAATEHATAATELQQRLLFTRSLSRRTRQYAGK
jgi:hypothetical protein